MQRWMNFAIQLEKIGWEPIILTPSNPQFELIDQNLHHKVDHLPVFKVPIWEPFHLFHKLTGNKEKNNIKQGQVMEKSKKTFFDKIIVWVRGNLLVPDPRVFWVKKASEFGVNLVKSEGIDKMITTGPPHSIHLIGRSIKKRTEVKWIADFRDPWSKWDVLEKLHTSSIVMEIHKQLEASVLKRADKITTVSKRMAENLPNAEIVTNGVQLGERCNGQPNSEYFTIGYFGMLNEMRNPIQLWQVLDQMCRENAYFASRLRIKLGGTISQSIMEQIAKLQELSGKVEYLGYLSHDKVKQEYATCDLLLLLLNKTNNAKWILPLKFFEYLTAYRMILCLGAVQSDLGDIMKAVEVGEIMKYEDLNRARDFIQEVFQSKRRPSNKDINALLNRFSHENLVRKLDVILHQLDEING